MLPMRYENPAAMRQPTEVVPMSPDVPRRTNGRNPPDDPIAALRAAIDAVAPTPPLSDDRLREFEGWLDDLARSGMLKNAPICSSALDMLEALAPRSSITEAMLRELEEARVQAQVRVRLQREVEAAMTATSPGAMLRELREKRGVSDAVAASAWNVRVEELLAVEGGSRPWWQLNAACFSEVANALHEPIDRLAAAMRAAAMRYFVLEVKERGATAFSRNDDGPAAIAERGEQIRFALAAIEDENRAATVFFQQVDDVVARMAEQEG